jgi:hypothetical protein
MIMGCERRVRSQDGVGRVVRRPNRPSRPEPASGRGGKRDRDARMVLTTAGFVLTTGCAWRHLPPVFGASRATVQRRFVSWTEAALAAAAAARAGRVGPPRRDRREPGGPRLGSGRNKGSLTGLDPTDRGDEVQFPEPSRLLTRWCEPSVKIRLDEAPGGVIEGSGEVGAEGVGALGDRGIDSTASLMTWTTSSRPSPTCHGAPLSRKESTAGRSRRLGRAGHRPSRTGGPCDQATGLSCIRM